MKIHSYNGWDQLRGVIVGRANYARWPENDPNFHAEVSNSRSRNDPTNPLNSPITQTMIDETNEDLEELSSALTNQGVKVLRPKIINWQNLGVGMYSYCPRDNMIVIGDTVIEAPMFLSTRSFEMEAFSSIRTDLLYHNMDAKWIAAPRRDILSSETSVIYKNGKLVNETVDVVFDAANICRLGDEGLIYLESCSATQEGGQWLQNNINVPVTQLYDIYDGSHIDTTIIPLREGLVLINADRIDVNSLPDILEEWDKIYVTDDMIEPMDNIEHNYASKWMAINMLSINPHSVIIDKNQTQLIKLLKIWGIESQPMQLRHARTLGGGFHCATLDIWRE